MSKKIVAFGELVWDVFHDGKQLGGAPVNLVYRVNSLGDSGFLLSRIGDDDNGKEALQILKQIGISTDDVQFDSVFPTGVAEVKLRKDYSPEYIIEPDMAFDHIEFTAEALKLVCEADCLVFGTLVQRYGISKNTLRELLNEAQGKLKYLDLKLRAGSYNRNILINSLRAANILRVKQNELFILNDELELASTDNPVELARELISRYDIDIVLVTRSKFGVYAVSKNDDLIEVPGHKIELIDTVGSGSAFSAGFLHIYLNNKNIHEALRFGNAAGALTAATHGAITSVSKNEILALLQNTQ